MLEKYVNLLWLIHYLGGRVDGRKKLQKLVYLSQQNGGPFQESFEYHPFGPFSEQLANELEEMKALGLVRETRESTSFGCRYQYELTEAGQALIESSASSSLEPFKELVAELGKYDARRLELKATILFLVQSDIPESELITRI
ncbi:MAG TPA: hypothetical protein GXX40_02360 [Firmicutes bacterium]|nr:hypothetical protein [Bacillota bacterium]